jgi:hypothetical protein
MANVTLSSTKGTILEAYQAAEQRVKELEAKLLNPGKEVATKKAEATIESAEKVIELDILNPKVIEGYTSLKEAIELKKKDLEDLFQIETSCYSLAALINAQNNQKETFNEEAKTKRIQLSEELDMLLEDIKTARITYNREMDELKKTTEKARNIEETEFKYNRDRSRMIDNNDWEDEKALRLKEITNKEQELDTRTDAIYDRETKMAELETVIASIPVQLAEAKESGYKSGKADADKGFVFEKRGLEANYNAKTMVLENKVVSLEETVARLTKEIDAAKAEVTMARSEVKDIAAKAVESAGSSKTISMMENLMRESSNGKNSK